MRKSPYDIKIPILMIRRNLSFILGLLLGASGLYFESFELWAAKVKCPMLVTALPQVPPKTIFDLLNDPSSLRAYEATSEDIRLFRSSRLKDLFPGEEHNYRVSDPSRLTVEEAMATWGNRLQFKNWLPEEVFALKNYMDSESRSFITSKIRNLEWRGTDLFFRLTVSALNRFPSLPGVTFRGIVGDSTELTRRYSVGTHFSEPSFMSVSTDLRVASGFIRIDEDGIIFEVHGKTAKDVSTLSMHLYKDDSEKELIFLPGTHFQVKKTKTTKLGNKEYVTIVIEEVESVQTNPYRPPSINRKSMKEIFEKYGLSIQSATDLRSKYESLRTKKISQLILKLFEWLKPRELTQEETDQLLKAFLSFTHDESTPIADHINQILSELTPTFNPSEIQTLYNEGFLGHWNLQMEERTGPQGELTRISKSHTGATPSQWYRDEMGVEWLLKPDILTAELQTSAEVISSLIYKHLGYQVPEIHIHYLNGRRYAAVRSVGTNLEESTLENRGSQSFRLLRYFAAYLKDYDRLKRGPNNFILPDGSFLLYDFGGTLGARSMGEAKEHLLGKPISRALGGFEGTSEISILLHSFKINDLPVSHPWRNLRREDEVAALHLFEGLKDKDLEVIASQARFSDPQDAIDMLRILQIRRDGFIEHLTDLR